MKKSWSKVTALALLTAGVLSLNSAALLAETKVLTAAVFTPIDSVWGAPLLEFAKQVETISQGELKIRVVGPEAIPATEQANALRSGLIDMLATYPGAYKHAVVEANVQDVSNIGLEAQRASGAYGRLDQLFREKINARMLSTYGVGVPFHLYLTHDIDKVEDLKGMRVRSNVLANAFFSELGLNQVSVPIPDVFTALERKVVSGYMFSLWGIDDMGWDDVTKVRVDPGFYTVVVNILLSERTQAKLSSEQQAILAQAAVAFEAQMSEQVRTGVPAEYERQAKRGIKSVNLGEAFAKQAQEAYWKELNRLSPTVIPELEAMLRQ